MQIFNNNNNFNVYVSVESTLRDIYKNLKNRTYESFILLGYRRQTNALDFTLEWDNPEKCISIKNPRPDF